MKRNPRLLSIDLNVRLSVEDCMHASLGLNELLANVPEGYVPSEDVKCMISIVNSLRKQLLSVMESHDKIVFYDSDKK